MTDFFRGVGWDLQWDFNLLTPSPSSAGNQWDPTAAGNFLDYCSQNDIKIPNFELGNGKLLVSLFPYYCADNKSVP